jgi:hypothetical protein
MSALEIGRDIPPSPLANLNKLQSPDKIEPPKLPFKSPVSKPPVIVLHYDSSDDEEEVIQPKKRLKAKEPATTELIDLTDEIEPQPAIPSPVVRSETVLPSGSQTQPKAAVIKSMAVSF